MPGISLVNRSVAGGIITGGGQGFVTADGLAVSVVGDKVTPHAPSKTPHSAASVMVQGSSFVTIDGIPVVFEGCSASCGHAATGESWFQVSG